MTRTSATAKTKTSTGLAMRSVYFATHHGVCYVHWKLPRWKQYLRELMAWGMNMAWFYFDARNFHHPWSRGFERNHPAEAAKWQRISDAVRCAHDLGLRVGLKLTSNEGFAGQADDGCIAHPMPKFTGDLSPHQLCPSTRKGRMLILNARRRLAQTFPFVNYYSIGIMDPGGCGCTQCEPWATNGYLSIAKDTARVIKQVAPRAKVLLTDSYMTQKEIAVFLRELRRPDTPFDGINDYWDQWSKPFPIHNRNTARQHITSMSRRVPKNKELWLFPDLSMTFSQRRAGKYLYDWGITAGNPLPRRFTEIMRLANRVVGITPYSEGVFEDFNKCAILLAASQPGVTRRQVIDAYHAMYFSDVDVRDFRRLIDCLERGREHQRDNPAAEHAWQAAQRIHRHLPPGERSAWRWQLLHMRAQVDHLIVRAGQSKSGYTCAQRELGTLARRLKRLYGEQSDRIPQITADNVVAKLLDFDKPTGVEGEGIM